MSDALIRGLLSFPPPETAIARYVDARNLGSIGTSLRATLASWIARSRRRKAIAGLAELDARLLRDIGVTPEQALRERTKWFWQE